MIEFIQKVPLFSLLNKSQLEAIAQICSRKTVRANSILFTEKDPGGEFYMILGGSVKIYTTGANGEEKILTMCRTGESFGEMSLIDGKPRSASASTLEDSTLIAISGDRFLGLLREHFDITLGIMRELGNRLRDTNQHVYDLTFLDARTRVIKSLIKLANKHGLRIGSTITIKLDLNYDEISQMAGVQKVTLMQVIRDLEEKQILQISPSDFKLDLSKLR
ncbi:Crp/Fnr family transcriptional regulator [Paenibacillus sp. GP183]|jgi:CRP/FNR family cyclic AMP-dependent transcriptional regulator|uniref:Crp/Fnr family transcriptional regulator n=1 Tax=Paenibacillus sp. GP183 TaxID=1882751 RepID=UPI00089446C2|nr:Crp/Fnr family transcriptional regulator [Paenibacillus sp. GP183]SEC71944.1 CRP/FNR family transcriptional regulator, anaerobic regulatory protein/CRP/FNR family transcriptional regulator, cyclic AMP receptor protein [Paenibacillus sp. GP183]